MPEINQDRLRLLESKERAHDDYMAAMRALRAVYARLELASRTKRTDLYALGFTEGYKQAMTDLEEAIVLADRERHAEMVDATATD